MSCELSQARTPSHQQDVLQRSVETRGQSLPKLWLSVLLMLQVAVVVIVNLAIPKLSVLFVYYFI